MRRLIILFFIILLTSCSEKISSNSMMINKIDKIVFCSDTPKELYTLLEQKFRLPIRSRFGEKYPESGLLNCGNVDLRITGSSSDSSSAVSMLALKPNIPLKAVKKILSKRNIKYGKIEKISKYSRSLNVKGIIEHTDVTFCEHAEFNYNKYQYPGGPLDIDSVQEIVISATDFEHSRKIWQNLLFPLQETENGYWKPGAGPAINLIAGKTNAISGLRVKVGSVQQAEEFLTKINMLGKTTANSVFTDPEKTYGISFEFTDSDEYKKKSPSGTLYDTLFTNNNREKGTEPGK